MDIKVPDIGDFKDVPVITILVAEGDTIEEETPLIELESDKATMEVPSPAAGKITGLKVKVGDKVTEGDVIMTIDPAGAEEKTPPKEQENDTPAGKARGNGQGGGSARGAEAHGREGRHPRRPRRSRLRPRWLLSGVPRRRSWPRRGPDRALPDARRRLPQRRLHPVQGPAARRQGHHRGRGDGRARHLLRQTQDRHRPAAQVEGRRRQAAHRRPLPASPSSARSRPCRASAGSPVPT